MTDPDYKNLTELYQSFSANHDAQRQDLLNHLQTEMSPPVGKVTSSPRLWRQRWFVPTTLSGLAALGAIAVLVWFLMPMSAAELSWAQVAKQLQQVRTATYLEKTITTYPDGKTTMDAEEVYGRAPDQSRSVHDPVTKWSQIWLVNPTGHPHTIIEFGPTHAEVSQDIFFSPPDIHHFDWLTHLRDMDGKQIVRKGEEIIHGQKLIRFEQPAHAFDPIMPTGLFIIWVDPATSLPVRFVAKVKVPASNGQELHTVKMDDLRFDPPLADSLFAWPDLIGKQVNQLVKVHVPPLISRDQLKLAITASDGTVLASAADFQPAKASHGNQLGINHTYEITPATARRLKDFSVHHTGQTLKIQIDGAGVQTLTIVGNIWQIGLVIQKTPASTTAPATRPH